MGEEAFTPVANRLGAYLTCPDPKLLDWYSYNGRMNRNDTQLSIIVQLVTSRTKLISNYSYIILRNTPLYIHICTQTRLAVMKSNNFSNNRQSENKVSKKCRFRS